MKPLKTLVCIVFGVIASFNVKAITADFKSTSTTSCTSIGMYFSDESTNGTPIAWKWDFGDGTTSINQNTPKGYTQAGIYDVTLIVWDSTSSDTITKIAYISVAEPPFPVNLVAHIEGFENPLFPNAPNSNNSWEIATNSVYSGWQVNSNAAYSGSNSIRINGNAIPSGEVFELITPPMNLMAVWTGGFTFKSAFARRTTMDTDLFQIYVTDDCEQSWRRVYGTSASSILPSTSTLVAGSFVPDSSEWRETYLNLVQQKYVRYKFVFETGGGNNFYLDDISFGGLEINDGISSEINPTDLVQTSPNPVIDVLHIRFKDRISLPLDISILDVMGKTIFTKRDQFVSNSNKIILKDMQLLPKGIYLLQLSNEGYFRTIRFVKS